jgi:hypothetical protein
MTTTTWTVTAMNCYPQEGGNTDVVFTVHWNATGVDGDYTASVYNTTSVPTPEGSFTPYADLTQEQVLGWVWANGVDKAATEAAVEQQIQNQINPPVVTPPLPWAQGA